MQSSVAIDMLKRNVGFGLGQTAMTSPSGTPMTSPLPSPFSSNRSLPPSPARKPTALKRASHSNLQVLPENIGAGRGRRGSAYSNAEWERDGMMWLKDGEEEDKKGNVFDDEAVAEEEEEDDESDSRMVAFTELKVRESGDGSKLLAAKALARRRHSHAAVDSPKCVNSTSSTNPTPPNVSSPLKSSTPSPSPTTTTTRPQTVSHAHSLAPPNASNTQRRLSNLLKNGFSTFHPWKARLEPISLILKPPSSSASDGKKGSLYLGAFEASTSLDLLKEKNIGAIVHVLENSWTPTFLAHDPSDETLEKDEECKAYPIKFHKISVADSSSPQHVEIMYKALDGATKFIKEQLEEKSVLVHCFQGVSRSATVVIAYVMREKKMGYDEAIKYVVERRNGVKPNEGFVKCLKRWEKEVASKGFE